MSFPPFMLPPWHVGRAGYDPKDAFLPFHAPTMACRPGKGKSYAARVSHSPPVEYRYPSGPAWVGGSHVYPSQRLIGLMSEPTAHQRQVEKPWEEEDEDLYSTRPTTNTNGNAQQ